MDGPIHLFHVGITEAILVSHLLDKQRILEDNLTRPSIKFLSSQSALVKAMVQRKEKERAREYEMISSIDHGHRPVHTLLCVIVCLCLRSNALSLFFL